MRSKKLLVTSLILLFNLASALDYELQDGFINLSIDNGSVWYHPKIQSAAAASAHSIEPEKIGYVDKNSDGKYILEIDKRLKKLLGLEENSEITIDHKFAFSNSRLVGILESLYNDDQLFSGRFELKLSPKEHLINQIMGNNFERDLQKETFKLHKEIFKEYDYDFKEPFVIKTIYEKFKMKEGKSSEYVKMLTESYLKKLEFKSTPIRLIFLPTTRRSVQISNPTKSNADSKKLQDNTK